jgi:lysophospholipase L1-like esterase
MGTAKSSWARYALALSAFLGVALAVLLAERLIEANDPNLLWRDPVSGDDGLKFYRFDPTLGLSHKPGFSAVYQGVHYTTNSLGARGGETAHARTSGSGRVVLLGDSVVWGFGVSDDQTLAVGLETEWAPAEVVNLGVAGYGTGQELVLLRHEGLRYRPDRVVLVFTIANDVEDTYFPDSAASYPANLFHLSDGELREDPFAVDAVERVGLWLSHNSFIVRYVSRARSGATGPQARTARAAVERSSIGRSNLERRVAHQPDLDRYAALRYLEPAPRDRTAQIRFARRGGLLLPDALHHYKVELAKQLLLEIIRTSEAAGAEVSVVLAPYRAQLSADAIVNPLTGELRRFLTERRAHVVDLLPLLRGSGEAPDALFLDSVHFSARGNQVAAALLARAIPRPVAK